MAQISTNGYDGYKHPFVRLHLELYLKSMCQPQINGKPLKIAWSIAQTQRTGTCTKVKKRRRKKQKSGCPDCI